MAKHNWGKRRVLGAGGKGVLLGMGFVLAGSLPGFAQTLTVMTHNDNAAWQTYFKTFTADTGVEVKLVHQDFKKLDKLIAAEAGGVSPDLVLLDSTVLSQAAAKGLVMNIAPQLDTVGNINASDFYPAAFSALGARGALYAMPDGFNPYAVYYNRAKFASAGLQEPTSAWTYDDYRVDAQKLTTGQDATKVWGTNGVQWEVTAWAAGGDLITPDGKFGLNDPEVIDAIQWEADLIHKYGVVPGDDDRPDVPFHGRFAVGMVGMHWAGPWYLGAYIRSAKSTIDWGVAVPPHWGAQGQAAKLYVEGWSIASQSRNQELAWTFLRWAASKKGAMAEGNVVPFLPTRKSLVTNSDLQIWHDFGRYSQAWIDTIAVSKTLPFDVRASEIDGMINDAIGDVEAGKKSAQQMIQEIRPKAEAVLLEK